MGAYTYTNAIVAGDFRGDGQLDLAVTNPTEDDIAILLGNGDGTFRRAVDYAVGIDPDVIVAGDFKGDGWLTWPSKLLLVRPRERVNTPG